MVLYRAWLKEEGSKFLGLLRFLSFLVILVY